MSLPYHVMGDRVNIQPGGGTSIHAHVGLSRCFFKMVPFNP